MGKASKIDNRVATGVLILFGIMILLLLGRVFLFDRFPVNSDSMAPSIVAGDKIGVNKLLFGARIYKNLDFFQGKKMQSWRVPGFRAICRNDIVVFNAVRGQERNKLEFNFSTVFVKRCVGLPGDTLSIVNGYYRNHSASGLILGIPEQQERLSTPDTLQLTQGAKLALKYTREQYDWTIFNLGPLYIPRAGATVGLDSMNYNIFRIAIEYETDQPLTYVEGKVRLGEDEITGYTFAENYYFMAGDHALNSDDSRYWGFVPESFIIGIAPRIISSRDPFSGKFRWNRLLKKI